jgi:glycosyltransferase involved in cell wall biosynthesis
MKILFAITKSNFGGAQRYVFDLAIKLKEQGHDVHVALGGSGKLKTLLEEKNIPVHQIHTAERDINILKDTLSLFRLFSIYKKVKPDVVHLNSPKIGGLGALSAKILGIKKVIYTNHGWPFKEDRPLWQISIIKILSWITILLNDKVIVLSGTEKSFVDKWPFIKNKISVIPNGILDFEILTRESAIHTINDIVNQPIKINTDSFIIGTIAELHKNKGLTYALEGVRTYMDQYPNDDIKYIIIGSGEEYENILKYIANNDLEGKIIMTGNIDDARRLLKAFDVFLLPSIKEGLPYVLLESGYCEVPVISTSVGGIPEMIENLKDGLIIKPKNPQEIQSSLIYHKNHKKDVCVMTKSLKNKISKKYNHEKMTIDVLNTYKFIGE